MSFNLVAPLFALALFCSMLVLLEVGRVLGRRRAVRELEGARAGIGAVEGAAFGLMGLLIAFTFSGAAGRFEGRRDLIVQEANAIGTAWLRLDLVPDAVQPELREDFRRYLDARLDAYEALPDMEKARAALARATQLQGEIWRRSVAACTAEGGQRLCGLLLPALNEMVDITTTRTMETENHPPAVIYALLVALALGCALMAGYAMSGAQQRPTLHMIGFAAVIALAVYVILDIEYPRLGWIRVDYADHVLRELRDSIDG